MNEPLASSAPERSPTRFLTVAVMLTGMVLVWFGWNTYSSYRVTREIHERLLRVQELQGVVTHLDEVLTMSARMAAATGDLAWEDRYRHFEPILDKAIKEIIELEPDAYAGGGAAETDAANIKLVEMEHRAFDLVRQNRAAQARDVLFSAGYAAQKQIYSQGMTRVSVRLKQRTHDMLKSEQQKAFLNSIAVLVSLPTLMIAWLFGLQFLRRWRDRLTENNQKLDELARKLLELNANLDQRVMDRTTQLEAAHLTELQQKEVLNKTVEEQKKANAELRQSEKRFRQLTENIDEVFWVSDPQFTKIIYISPAYERIWGATQQSLYDNSKSFANAIHPDDRERILAKLPDQAQGGFDEKYRIVQPNGSVRWIHARTFPIRDERGEVYRACGIAQDITERRRAEEKIQQLSKAVEQSPACVIIADVQGNIEYVNPKFEQLTGYTLDEALGKNPRILKSGHTPPEVYEQLWKTISSGGEWRGEFHNRKKNGELYWESASISVVRDDQGVIQHYLAVKEDITERKQTEEALRGSQRFLEGLLNTIPVQVFWKDRDGKYLGCNTLFAQDAGVNRPEELIGKDDYDLVWRDQADLYRQDDRQVIDSGIPKLRIEEPQTTPDGRTIYLLTSKIPLRDAEGNTIGLLGAYQDITERKRNEEALREAHDALRMLVQASPMAIVALNSDATVAAWNPAAERLWGWKEAEILDRPLPIVPENERAYFQERHARELAGEVLEALEVRAVRKDGTPVDVLLSSAPRRDGQGKVVGTMALMIDISERKRAEGALQEAKEVAEAASRAKSDFLANMSHEIRTPMNGIIGMTELALDTDLTPEQREYLNLVKDSAESLLTLINDILDFSKIEAGKFGLDSIEFNLADCLSNTLKTHAPPAGQKRLELTCQLLPDVPTNLVGDPTRLRQILNNLLGNAIKFTARGDVHLTVKTESRTDSEACLHFTVRDTGVGIPQEKQRMIFEAFAQADTSMTRKYGGTGLGLTISSRLVEMMGGRLRVESEPGKGSTFHFTARLGIQKTPAPVRSSIEMISLAGMCTLVVDDNGTNRRILDAMLKHWLMIPTLTDGGWAGLEAMKQARDAAKPFPLVLIDSQMPDMDGFALAEKIIQDPSLAGATVMMLTSAGQRGDAARCRELGIAAYLIKPIRQSELLDAILTTLGTPVAAGARPRLVTRHSLREARRKFRVLLAEDNAVNQTLAVRLLEKMGHSVVVAANGCEALEALRKQDFDMVLMDVQMPEMDGFMTTAAIREEEMRTGRHLPIAAMTAHTMKGDREKCLASGMDSYIGKPIDPNELFNTIESLGAGVAATANRREEDRSAADIFDEKALREHVDGDDRLLGELVELFRSDCPARIEEARYALAVQDSKALERSAHSLKGMVGNFAAKGAFEAALELERIARSENLENAERLLEALEKEITILKSALIGLLERIPK